MEGKHILKTLVPLMAVGAAILVTTGYASAQQQFDAKQVIEKMTELHPEVKRFLENQPELAERLTQLLNELPAGLNWDMILRTVAARELPCELGWEG